MNSYITGGELVVQWKYSTKHYHPETISKIAAPYLSELQELISHTLAQSTTIYTPLITG